MVWAYALVSFFVASAVKIGVYRMIAHQPARQARHLARVEGWLFNHFHHIWASKGSEAMKRSILVATDGSEAADRAVDYAASLAKREGADLLIANVIGGYGLPDRRLLPPHAPRAGLAEGDA